MKDAMKNMLPMDKINPILIILAIICVQISGIFQSGYLDADMIRKEIIAMTNAYNKTWETVDMEKGAAWYSEDFKYYWHGTLTAGSNAEFIKNYKEIMSTTKEWSMEIDEIEVQVLGRNAAIIGFIITSTHLITTENQPFDYGTGAMTYVWKRIDGDWKLAHIHESPKD